MPGKPRNAEKQAADGDASPAQASTAGAGTTTGLTEDVQPSSPAEGRFEGHRSATVNLPFVTAQFRVPDVHAPSRDDLGAAARGARSMLPSTKSMLFFGGLAATAVVGAVEWPVAAAIGVGTALAGRRAADPQPRGGASAQAETSGSTTATGEARA